MVVIPAGNFEMGSPRSEAGRLDTEGPTHRVDVSAFALARTEVTRQQFSAFVAETGYQAGGSCYTLEGGKWAERPGRNWQNPGYA
jgi:formylglycine-generating enzyme required for sulfatase activity